VAEVFDAVIENITNILLEAEDGVIDADNPVTSVKEPEAVVKSSVLCVDTTCNTLPAPDNLVPAIAALALISALTIVPSVIPSDCIFVSGMSKFLL
jgi:hypothetical protein